MNSIKDLFYTGTRLIRQPRNSAIILAYHSVSTAKISGAVSPEQFEQHMQVLKKCAFNVVSLDQLAQYRKQGAIPPKTVCITFDDGYRDNYTTAFPILEKYTFPATVFVVTDVIGSHWEVRGEQFEMLSEADIQKISTSGLVTVAPHTASHAKLDSLSMADAMREIHGSKTRIESITGSQCHHFAYPFGRMNDTACAAVRDAGIEYAYTISPGFVHIPGNNLSLSRNAIDRTTTRSQFHGIAQWGRLSRSRFL